MGTDYGVVAFYGVMLDDEDIKLLQPAIDVMLDKREREDSGDNPDDVLEAVLKTRKYKPLRDQLYANYQIPSSLSKVIRLVYTGDEYDRPGRCVTPIESWLLGVFFRDFPDRVPVAMFTLKPDSRWKKQADWHEWVWAG